MIVLQYDATLQLINAPMSYVLWIAISMTSCWIISITEIRTQETITLIIYYNVLFRSRQPHMTFKAYITMIMNRVMHVAFHDVMLRTLIRSSGQFLQCIVIGSVCVFLCLWVGLLPR